MANGFPASPGGGGFWEEVEKAKPSEPADTAPQGAKKAERGTDKLRQEQVQRVPVESPLREAAPWLVLAAIGTIVVLWVFMGREKPKPAASEPAADLVAAPQLPTVSATVEGATVPSVTSEPAPAPPPSGTDNGTQSPSAEVLRPTTQSGAETPTVRAPRSKKGERKPINEPTSAPAVSATAPTPSPAPKATTQDDASPFGKWTAPPRD